MAKIEEPALEDPQNKPINQIKAGQQPAEVVQPSAQAENMDPEFLNEIEVYLTECQENKELSIDMSDTLI